MELLFILNLEDFRVFEGAWSGTLLLVFLLFSSFFGLSGSGWLCFDLEETGDIMKEKVKK